MSGYLLSVVIFLSLHSSLALKNLDEPRYKSFQDAELECAEYLLLTNETLERYRSNGYPDELSVRKLVNCIFIDLNAWDEDQQEVKDYVFNRFFVPSTTDCQYAEHTSECLDQNVDPLNTTDTLGRKYQSFQCYYRNYAGINDEVKWVPYHDSEFVQTNEDCMRMENLSMDSLLQLCQGQIVSNPGFPNLAYCFLVRSGFYNKTTGMDLEKLYVQYGAELLLDDYTKQCVENATKQYCKEPERLVHIVVDCLIEYLPAAQVIIPAASNVLGNPPECVVPPSPPPKTQPCYNAPCA